jgi:hypothetical protein
MRTIIILCIFLINTHLSLAQASAGFYIERGSQVPFVFNSFAKLQDGVTYTDWTRIRIKMQELTVDATDTFALGWTLSYRATTAAIVGDRGVPADYLPLNTLRLASTDNSTNPPQQNAIGLTDLTAAFQTLSNATPGLHVPNTLTGVEETILDVTYECGANNGGCPLPPCNQLFGRVPDNYTVDIELLITVP